MFVVHRTGSDKQVKTLLPESLNSMKVLVIGSGGREHALCWAISASPICDALYCAPGNGGIEDIAECVDLTAMDFDGIVAFCGQQDIDFVVVGPEDPLCAGIVDRLTEKGIKAFGPSVAAAQLEGSKGFTKDLCAANDIPTAAYQRFTEPVAAKSFAADLGLPVVIKADGLAAGKGVVIAETEEQVSSAIDEMLAGRFGDAGAELVVEEFLQGEEASFFALIDGEAILPLASAQDHKRVGDGDVGPNTGGMGAYSPAPVMTDGVIEQTMERIIRPTVRALSDAGTPFKGVLFAGLMITSEGPKLIEYNVRFGDPECQVLMMRLKSDILPALVATADGMLAHVDLRWSDETALTVVMATEGYPGNYAKGSEINGAEAAASDEAVEVFHAGTKRRDGKLLANGGRVLNVTAVGGSVADAQRNAYAAIGRIDWPEGFCRRDIGWRAIELGTRHG